MYIPYETFIRPPEGYTFLAAVAEDKMNRFNDEIETYKSIGGLIFQTLPLSTDVTLRRELHEDDTHGPLVMKYQARNSNMRWYDEVEIKNGDVYYRFSGAAGGHTTERSRLSGLQRGILLAKIIKGKPDYKNREDKFFGDVQER